MPDPIHEHRPRLARRLTAAIAGALLAAHLVGLAVPAIVPGLLAAVGALTALALRDRARSAIGPRHLLDLTIPFSALVLLVLAVRAPLDLPAQLRWLTHPLIGASLALTWIGATALPSPGGSGTRRGSGLALLAGVLVWIGAVGGLGVGVPFAYLALFGAMLAVWAILWPVEDPVHPGASPLAPYLPWGEIPGRPWPAWHRVPLRAPATLGYLVLSWTLFLWLGEPGLRGWWGLDTVRYEAWLYEIPELSRAPLDAAVSMVTAPLLNHDHIQLIYVTALLGLFGLPFELREGTARAAGLFAATSLAGALVAGVVLHGLYPAWPGVGVLEHAWERTWSGGSVGAFGLMGALSARARRPWLVFGFFVFWELNVGAWMLRSYTPMFHLTALVTGFWMTRAMAPRQA